MLSHTVISFFRWDGHVFEYPECGDQTLRQVKDILTVLLLQLGQLRQVVMVKVGHLGERIQPVLQLCHTISHLAPGHVYRITIHCTSTLFFFFKKKNHYAPVSQANWCNMIFTVGNLFPSHSCIGWPKSSPTPGFKPRSPASEADDLPTELSLPPFTSTHST